MDKLERAQIRLLLDHLGAELRREIKEQNKAMHAQQAARGLLKSGATIKSALRIAEELATEFVKKAFDAAASVAQDLDSFNMVLTDVTIIFRDLRLPVNKAVSFAAGPGESDASREADRLFLELQKRVLRLAEIHRFSFTRPSPAAIAAISTKPLASPDSRSPKNKGGAPLAAHWDEMWATIAVQLWEGDLKPKRQKDISDAMFAWLSKKELDAGKTAVTDRARILWQMIETRLRG